MKVITHSYGVNIKDPQKFCGLKLKEKAALYVYNSTDMILIMQANVRYVTVSGGKGPFRAFLPVAKSRL